MARWQRDQSKERFWSQTIRQWQRSGLSVRNYCASRGLSEPSFYAWRRALRHRAQAKNKPARSSGSADTAVQSPPPFLPVRVVPADTTAPATPIELLLRAGHVVRVAAGFDPATLRQLLAVLEEPSC